MKIPQRVALNTAVQFAARLLLTAVGLVTFALVARHLGLEGFGSYSLVLTFIPLFASIADLGVTTIAVREISRRPDSARQVVSNVLTVKAAFSLAAALLLLAAVPLLPYSHELRIALALALVGLVLQVMSLVPSVLFQSRLRMDLQAAVDVSVATTNLGLVIVVLLVGGGLYALVLAWVASVGVGCALAYGLALRLTSFRPAFDRALAGAMVRRALPLGLVTVLGIIHFRVDAILLSLLRPIGDVGVYNAAYRFLEQALVAPALFMTAIFPVLAGYAAAGDPRLAATVRKALTFLLLLGAPIGVGAFVLAEPIVTFVAGTAFGDATTPLRILLVAVVIGFVTTIFVNLLIVHDLLGRLLVVSVVSVALNIGLNLALIPRYTYNGAAVATVITEGLAAVVIATWAIRHCRLRIEWSPALRIGIAAAAMGLVVLASSEQPLAVPIVAGSAVYAGLVLALRIVDRRDLRVLLQGED